MQCLLGGGAGEGHLHVEEITSAHFSVLPFSNQEEKSPSERPSPRGGQPSMLSSRAASWALRELQLALGSGKRPGCAAAGPRSWKAALCPVTCGCRIVSCGRAAPGSPGRTPPAQRGARAQHPRGARCNPVLLAAAGWGSRNDRLVVNREGRVRATCLLSLRERRCVAGERTLGRFLQPLQPWLPSWLLVTLAFPALDLERMVTVVTKLVYCFHFR